MSSNHSARAHNEHNRRATLRSEGSGESNRKPGEEAHCHNSHDERTSPLSTVKLNTLSETESPNLADDEATTKIRTLLHHRSVSDRLGANPAINLL